MSGLAKHVSEDLINKGNCNPIDLLKNIERYYDCNVNKTNVILYEIKHLLTLELTTSVQATKFISDFRESLQRLGKVKAKIAEDNDTLRAFLLLAIQDQTFDTVLT